MTLQFGSGGGAPSFATAPAAGAPSIAIGTGTFAGGAAPDFQGTSAIGVNMAPGYAQGLIDLQVAGLSKFRVDSGGNLSFSTYTATGNSTILGFIQVRHLRFSGTFTKTVNYTLAVTTDSVIIANAASLTMTLPIGVSGDFYVIKNGPLGTNTTVAATSGTIDGAATDVSLSTAFAVGRYVSDGTNWFKV